ncbi:MAG: hypothetical protein ABUK01_07080 [Leptospirales bacterium]
MKTITIRLIVLGTIALFLHPLNSMSNSVEEANQYKEQFYMNYSYVSSRILFNKNVKPGHFAIYKNQGESYLPFSGTIQLKLISIVNGIYHIELSYLIPKYQVGKQLIDLRINFYTDIDGFVQKSTLVDTKTNDVKKLNVLTNNDPPKDIPKFDSYKIKDIRIIKRYNKNAIQTPIGTFKVKTNIYCYDLNKRESYCSVQYTNDLAYFTYIKVVSFKLKNGSVVNETVSMLLTDQGDAS